MSDQPAELFIAKEPKLKPSMLVPRSSHPLDRYPFTDPSIRYHYLGRNASYALVKALGISGGEMLFPSWFGGPVLEAPRRAGANITFYPVRFGARVDPKDILDAITPSTRAIYLIHYVGFPAPVQEVLEICRERGVLLIEDCAHALLTTIDGQPAGTFGDGAIFSFYKWVPVPNGAALTFKTGDESQMLPAERSSLSSGIALSAFSMLDSIAMRFGSPGRAIRSTVRAAGRRARDVTSISYVGTGGIEFSDDELSVAMSGISHHILANQPLEEIAAKRRENYEHLAELLVDVAPPLQGRLSHGVTPLFYPTRVLYKTAILDRLKMRGVEGRNFWEFHDLELPGGTWLETDDLRETVLELPIHQDLGPKDIERMAIIVRQTIGAKVIPAPGQYKPSSPAACAVVLGAA